MTETFFSCVWPTFGEASRLIWIGPPLAGMNGLALAAGHVLAERDLDIGLGELVGEEPLAVVVGQGLTDRAGSARCPGRRPDRPAPRVAS